MLPDFVQPYLDNLEDIARHYLSELEDRDIDYRFVGGAAAVTFVLIQAARIMLSRFTSSSVSPTISIKWGREKFHIPLPEPDAKVGALRSIVAEKTGLDPSAFKLVHSGGVMKDNNASISACGIKKGSKIVVIDGAAHANGQSLPEKREKKAKPTTEEGSREFIRDELQRITDSLAPALDVFLKAIETPTASDPTPITVSSAPQPTASTIPADKPTAPDVDYEHRRLNEEFVQSLLRLDSLDIDSVWQEARTDRKGAIRTVQALLDRLDKGWRERTEKLAAQ